MRYLILVLALLAVGCTSPYYRSLDGTSTSVGLCVPESDTMRLDVVQYLSGSRVSVKDKGTITHEYKCSSTNSYFGLIRTQEHRESRIVVRPAKAMDGYQTDAITNVVPSYVH